MSRTHLPQLFAELPSELAPLIDLQKPWEFLAQPLDELLSALPSQQLATRLNPDVCLFGDRIVVGSGARIHSGAVIEGPIRIGNDVEIRPGAYLRGGCWIGDGCVIGANSELKRAVLLDGAKAPHLNYVGDSILGRGVNLGAGTILSNFRHDGGDIQLPTGAERITTGLRKLGAILGDGVATGCNCVLHPGVIVGAGTQLYPGVQLRSGIYPEKRLIKLQQQIQIVERQER